jgi:hypothetical protein
MRTIQNPTFGQNYRPTTLIAPFFEFSKYELPQLADRGGWEHGKWRARLDQSMILKPNLLLRKSIFLLGGPTVKRQNKLFSISAPYIYTPMGGHCH